MSQWVYVLSLVITIMCAAERLHVMKCVCRGDERRADISNHCLSKQTGVDCSALAVMHQMHTSRALQTYLHHELRCSVCFTVSEVVKSLKSL